jgi:hypothetical protein
MMQQDILTTKTDPPPRLTDARIAMRVPSFVVFLASAVLTCIPILYYGVSQHASSLNFWLVGGILLCSASLRLWYPFVTIGFSWFNAILGVWGFISAWIFDYPTSVIVTTCCVSALIIGMSLASVFGARFIGTPIATAYEDRQGLQDQEDPDIGPDRRWDRW